MSFARKVVAAAIALSMTGTPVLAQSAAPLSVAAPLDRSGAQVGHANRLLGIGEYGVPLALFAAVIIAIVLLNNHDEDDLPMTP